VIKQHFALQPGGRYEQYATSLKRRSTPRTRSAGSRRRSPAPDRRAAHPRRRAHATQIRPIESPSASSPHARLGLLPARRDARASSPARSARQDEQIIDGLLPEYSKKFTLHYNFPPFATGEAKRITGPGRREIGHGALAERSLMGVLPSPEEFPTHRIVSDITESNGSSSMPRLRRLPGPHGRGVPIKATCAGILHRRFADDHDANEIFVTDIIGEEDFFGDMDFKVSGTREGSPGSSSTQARGLTLAQLPKILEQARVGRLEIIA